MIKGIFGPETKMGYGRTAKSFCLKFIKDNGEELSLAMDNSLGVLENEVVRMDVRIFKSTEDSQGISMGRDLLAEEFLAVLQKFLESKE